MPPIQELVEDPDVPTIEGEPEPGTRSISTAVITLPPGYENCLVCGKPATRDMSVPLKDVYLCTRHAVRRMSHRLAILMPWTKPKKPIDPRST